MARIQVPIPGNTNRVIAAEVSDSEAEFVAGEIVREMREFGGVWVPGNLRGDNLVFLPLGTVIEVMYDSPRSGVTRIGEVPVVWSM